MMHNDALVKATQARAIAESLIPENLRDVDWKARWDGLEAVLAVGLSDCGLRDVYVQIDQEAGERGQDVLSTACFIRNVDL